MTMSAGLTVDPIHAPPDVQVVICTCDRPEPLRRLLLSIAQQKSALTYQVIVVDNHPAARHNDGLKAEFPHVQWIPESRRGLSFARNTGIRATRSEVVVFADDDMQVEPDWLSSLASPVAAHTYDLVLGPISPIRLESATEILFEAYGAHGHKDSRDTFDAVWLHNSRLSLPMWQVGGIGNSAIRRSVFQDPHIGVFDEALGVGTPAGSSEDLYFLYRVLRANGRVLREPAATVKHAHRETFDALAKQLFDYRRGEVCFCLLVLIRHGDLRGLTHLAWFIPSWRTRLFAQELMRRLRGQRLFSFRLMFREAGAYIAGPAALVASLRRAAKLKESDIPKHFQWHKRLSPKANDEPYD